MNYIKFKNQDSRYINGLVISELPPITKPQMRVSETVVDGVDGSYIEELGYSSYDKPVTIGLTQRADINEVIKFFSGKGDVIFSNEPDKYYRGKIIDQINYERLVRFKKAKIKINVQPFKFSAIERVKTITPEGQTLDIWNNGNTTAKPLIGIYGSGDINLSLNGLQVCTITGLDDYIALDCENLEAFKGETLKNRQMNGKFPVLKIGKNTFTWTGNVTKVEFTRFSRWL